MRFPSTRRRQRATQPLDRATIAPATLRVVHPPAGSSVAALPQLIVLASVAFVVVACGLPLDGVPAAGASASVVVPASAAIASLPAAASADVAATPRDVVPDDAASPAITPPAAAVPERRSPHTLPPCSGTSGNLDFYLAVAEAVDWTVLCPVLPDGWFVEAGTYRLAGGGWLDITYRGPGGARLQLREGAFCAEPTGCVPEGSEVDEVAVGPLPGRLIATDDGRWAAVVDRGAQRSWLVAAAGVDEATFRALAGSLVAVAS